jgi:hypothetical protein
LAARLSLFGVNADGQVHHRAQSGTDHSVWGPWKVLPGALRPTLLPTTAPQAHSPGDQSTLLGTPVDLHLTQTGGVAPVAWTFSGLPAGLTGTITGQIAGAPLPSGTPTHLVTATATDANQASSSVSFTWTTLVTVPDVRGISKQKAAEEIHHAGLTLGPDSLNNQCIEVAGTVVDQSPNQGQLAPEGASVRLTVSRGLDSHGHKCPEEK